MKNLILFISSITFLLNSYSATASDMSFDPNQNPFKTYNDSKVILFTTAVGPFGLSIVVGMLAASKTLGKDTPEKKLPNTFILKEHKICDNLKNISINADELDIYTGYEKPNYSHINKVTELTINPFDKTEKYLCIKPTKTKVFENGCLDLFKDKKYTKASGIWTLNRIFEYHNVFYAQFKNKEHGYATTEVFASLKHAKYGDEPLSNYINNIPDKYIVSIPETIKKSCKTNK